MPDWKQYIREHLVALEIGPERELEIVDEIAQHLEAVYEEALANGASKDEGIQRAQAHIKDWNLLECELARSKRLGTGTWNEQFAARARTEPPGRSGGVGMGSLGQDFRYGARMLLKNKAFTAVAIFSLAVGIGANTAIFSVINAVMLRILPVKAPQQLVLLSLVSPERTSYSFNYPLIERLAQHDEYFIGIIAASSVSRMRMSVAEPGSASENENVQQAQVSGNYFSVLGAEPIIGRGFNGEDDSPSNPRAVAVISYDFWKRRFALDPTVVGKNITLNEFPFTIVGVAPQGFFGFEVGRKPDLWWPIRAVPLVTPANQTLKQNTHWWLRVIGRLRPGATAAQARDELDAVLKQQIAEIVAEDPSRPERFRFIKDMRLEVEEGGTGWTTLRQQFKKPLFILMAVVGLVLLTACANVANLMLARSSTRRSEFAIRLAIGAGRARIVRQLLTESLMLAAAGGAVGLLIAKWGSRALLTYLPGPQTSGLDLGLDPQVLGFTLGLSLLTGVLFGLTPALQSTRLDLVTSLKNQKGWAGRSRFATNKILVVAQVALSLFLVIGAALFVRTLKNLKSVDTGFDSNNLVQFTIDSRVRLDAGRRARLYKELLTRLETLPGVQAASMLSFPLLAGNNITNRIAVVGQASQTDQDPTCYVLPIGPRFFETMGMTLLSGRDFTTMDERIPDQPTQSSSAAEAPVLAVINQSMAHQFFANEDPIGKRFSYESGPGKKPVFEVIGLVNDAKYTTLRDPAPKTYYVSYLQQPGNFDMTFQLKTLGNVSGLGAEIQRTLSDLDPGMRVTGLQTVNDLIDQSLNQERFIAQISGFFSLFALLLASVGLYGIMSHNVTRRTNEIGIRMALGALPGDVLGMVMREAMTLVAIGVIIGLGAAIATTRYIESFLFGLTATDPVTIAAAILVMLAVAATACFLPARRASSVDPMTALRYE